MIAISLQKGDAGFEIIEREMVIGATR